jgi:hypothetical protein
MVRGNIKTIFEFQRRWQESAGAENLYFRPNGFLAGIDYVF